MLQYTDIYLSSALGFTLFPCTALALGRAEVRRGRGGSVGRKAGRGADGRHTP